METTFLENIYSYLDTNKSIKLISLQELYRENNSKSNESDFFWALQELKQQKILKQIDEENYQIVFSFKPKLTDRLILIHHYLSPIFDLTNYCIWSSEWYNQFSKHQIIQNFISVEIEKEAAESVFYELKKANLGEVFLILQKEDEVLLDKYVFEAENAIIIQKIITKSPTQLINIENELIPIPYLEKMLVDLFVDTAILSAYKGVEQVHIFETALLNYAIDFKKMFAYSKRRGKEKELKNYLFQHFKNQINLIFS